MIIQEFKDLLSDKNIKYFMTGSREWDVNTGFSDYDICIRYNDNSKVNLALSELNYLITDSEYNNGYKFGRTTVNEGVFAEEHTVSGDIINVIPLPPIELYSWWQATNMLRSMSKAQSECKESLKLKPFRISLFKQAVSLATSSVSASSQVAYVNERYIRNTEELANPSALTELVW